MATRLTTRCTCPHAGGRRVLGGGIRVRQVSGSVRRMSAKMSMVTARSILYVLLAASLSCRQPVNEIPMYGGLPKNECQLYADKTFMAWAVRTAGSPEKASAQSVQAGWRAMSEHDWRVAMRRFNQAWLLDSDNPDVYWGFGAACGLERDYECSITHFTKATQLDPANPTMLADFAFTYIRRAQRSWFSKSEPGDL